MGWSSPTWYGTETINAVSKGYDFGPDYAGDNFGDKVHFGEEEITLSTKGDNVKNDIITNYLSNDVIIIDCTLVKLRQVIIKKLRLVNFSLIFIDFFF